MKYIRVSRLKNRNLQQHSKGQPGGSSLMKISATSLEHVAASTGQKRRQQFLKVQIAPPDPRPTRQHSAHAA